MGIELGLEFAKLLAELKNIGDAAEPVNEVCIIDLKQCSTCLVYRDELGDPCTHTVTSTEMTVKKIPDGVFLKNLLTLPGK